MKRSILLLLSLAGISLLAQQPQVTHVLTHQRTTIVTDPSKGENPYPGWGVFPSGETDIRKILMHVTLGSPDSMPTAHWDYRDHIHILRTGGSSGKSLNLEIGRMLTPYGSTFSKGWEFTWTIDVTDFAMVLRDSVEIEYIHSGYEPTTVGWALTIDFEITPGPPHIHPLSIKPMWKGAFNYGNPDKPIEEELKPIVYTPSPDTKLSRLRILHTGHGMDQPKGCSEFCSRWRRILLNGEVIQDKDLWKTCGDNPLYPQGGTWIFDRALWCPGDLQNPDVIDVHPISGENTFEILMEPYVATENIQAQEFISSVIIEYSAPLHTHDVAVEAILEPNNRPLYNRTNPRCFDARVRIRNLGSEDLTSLTIEYGTVGFPTRKVKWTGLLPYYAAEELILPGAIDFAEGENTFSVQLKKPNGKKDAWNGDNQMHAKFDSPKVLPENIIIQYRTNRKPEENEVFINGSADRVFHKGGGETLAETVYLDTLNLPQGLYEMYLTDSGGQGLEFWYMRDQGFGYLRISDLDGNLLHLFTPDCGNGEMLAFRTDPGFRISPEERLYDFSLYPKMVSDAFELEVYTGHEIELEIVLTHEGVAVEKHHYPKTPGGVFTFNIEHLPENRYIAEVYIDGELKYKSRCQKVTPRRSR